MKTHLLAVRAYFLSILLLFLTTACPPSEDEEYGEVEIDGVEGTWILRSATFREPVDLDGSGNRQPITDAKMVLYDLIGVYNNCSSIDEIPFEFTDEPAKQKDQMGQYGSSARSANAVCPQGQGVTSWIFDYYFSPNLEDDDSYPLLYIFLKDAYDPGELFTWQGGFILRITQTEIRNEIYTISGHLYEGSMVSSLPEPKPDLTFDFVMERIDPQ